ncbi:DUF826 domain-containing protein, partial [Escherichia coli]
MSEITSLVTAEAVKEVLRSEEVLSALKQKLRHNLELPLIHIVRCRRRHGLRAGRG